MCLVIRARCLRQPGSREPNPLPVSAIRLRSLAQSASNLHTSLKGVWRATLVAPRLPAEELIAVYPG
jgi:hypothetical protein